MLDVENLKRLRGEFQRSMGAYTTRHRLRKQVQVSAIEDEYLAAREALEFAMLEALPKLIAIAEAARWIPVGERLPTPYETVLVGDVKQWAIGFFGERKGWMREDGRGGAEPCNPSHWRRITGPGEP